ncbi:MAG: Flp family type IVb pilin [Rhizobiales bacterium]|nr:Flp family type IVb pilin [Hyphomicrobiales bacterium]
MRSIIGRFILDTSAATAIEYGIIAAGIAVVIVGSVNSLGLMIRSDFDSLSNGLNGGGGPM